MDVRAVRTEADYQWALCEFEQYFIDQPALGTPEAKRFDVLAALLKAYEDEHHPIPETDPVDVLHYASASMGRSQAELADVLGSRSRASEILHRKRALNLDMIRSISAAWKIPMEALAAPDRVCAAQGASMAITRFAAAARKPDRV